MKNEKKLYFTKKPPWIGMLEKVASPRVDISLGQYAKIGANYCVWESDAQRCLNAQDRPNMQPRPDWTKTAPTKPGYYWWRDTRKHFDHNPTIVQLLDDSWCFSGSDMGASQNEMIDWSGEFWSKPIAPPEE